MTDDEPLSALIERRIGQEFDGECHLSEEEARRILQLFARVDKLKAAASCVLSGLFQRIEKAPQTAVPLFDGIADLSDALNALGERAKRL